MSDGLKSSRSRVGNLEIVIAITGLGALLLANVLFDRFIRYIATGRYGTLQYLNVVRAADLPDQIPNADANRTGQNRLAVLRHPHKVVFDIVAAMRAAAVVFHPSNRRTLRFRLKARVLNPSSGQ